MPFNVVTRIALTVVLLAVPLGAGAQHGVTVIGVAYHSTGKSCADQKHVAGWAWQTTTGASAKAQAAVEAKLKAQFGPLFGSPDIAYVSEPFAALITYRQPISGYGGCEPRRKLKVGRGADSASAVADAVRRKDGDMPGAEYTLEQVVRRR